MGLVQKVSTTGASSLTLNGVLASNTLILLIGQSGQALTTPSGFTPVNVPAAYTGNSIEVNNGIYINTSPSAGTNTVTLQSFTLGVLLEWSGLAVSPIDINTPVTNNTGTTGSSNTSVSTGTLAQASEVIFAINAGTESGSGVSNVGMTDPPTGFTSLAVNQDSATSSPFEICYQVVNSHSSVTAQWTYTDGSTWTNQAVIASFKLLTSTVSFVSALAAPFSENTGLTSATSAAFTPTAGNTILAWGSAFGGTSQQPMSITGSSGSYSVTSPPGQWLDTQDDAYIIGGQLSAINTSQTVSINASTDVGQIIGHWTQFSGVGSIVSVITGGNNNTAPGSGPGAVVGVACTVPVGSILVAWCSLEDTLNETLTVANGGSTALASTNDALNLLTLCVGYWMGNGTSMTPLFTASGGTQHYTVLQVILTPSPSTTIAWLT